MPFIPQVIRSAPWSVSKADSLNRCLSLFKRKYIDKDREETKHASSKVGTATHYVLEVALANPGSDLHKLAEESVEKFTLVSDETRELNNKLADVSNFVTRIRKFKEERGVTYEQLEEKMAIDTAYNSVAFFDSRALLRGVIDQIMITRDKIAVIIDHKTGRKKPIEQHSVQFYAYMLMAAAKYDIVGAQCAINYVGSPSVDWFPKRNGDPGVWTRNDIASLRPWLETFLNQNGRSLDVLQPLAKEEEAPTNPNILCGWCGYLNKCEAGQQYVENRRKNKETKGNL